jgi:hypothetical protein
MRTMRPTSHSHATSVSIGLRAEVALPRGRALDLRSQRQLDAAARETFRFVAHSSSGATLALDDMGRRSYWVPTSCRLERLRG